MAKRWYKFNGDTAVDVRHIDNEHSAEKAYTLVSFEPGEVKEVDFEITSSVFEEQNSPNESDEDDTEEDDEDDDTVEESTNEKEPR